MYYTNQDARSPVLLTPGVYGLSNEELDSPWAKVTHGKERFRSILLEGAAKLTKEDLTSQLLELLADKTWQANGCCNTD